MSHERIDERLVLEAERRVITGVGRSRWAVLEAAGEAPARRALGNRAAWLHSELIAWIRSQPVGAPKAPRRALAARGITPDAKGARRMNGSDTTVHALQAGSPLCRFSDDVPASWPAGALWVEAGDPGVTCEACLEVAALLGATEKDWNTAEAMIRMGGSFVKILGHAAHAADPMNLAKIKATWPEYWTKYEELARTFAQRRATAKTDAG